MVALFADNILDLQQLYTLDENANANLILINFDNGVLILYNYAKVIKIT